jgi:predicted thioesterase
MEINMNEKLETGLTRSARISVDDGRTISFMGDEGRVYATPELVRDIEMTCRDLLLEVIDTGQDSVGTHIDVSHIAATPIGMWAEIKVTVTAIDGRAVTFEIDARDPVEQICHGKHSRFIVDIAKTIARLKEKADAAAAA